ncbi:DNA-binding response regulator [Bacteroidia bacterium]|nr:DNA-binding response regulator [Bacteroidia bacterium]
METKKLLIVDDEESICEILQFNLENEGFTVDIATSGEEALKKVVSDEYQIIILDIMMGGLSGLRVAEKLRKSENFTPIIFLSAKNTENDLLTGFAIGGDDYIFKPFSIKEVIARVRAILRREQLHQPHANRNSEYIAIGDVKIYLESRVVKIKNEVIALTKTEYELLHLLMESPTKIHTRAEILKQVWPNESYVLERTVDVHIARLRKKMNDYGHYIHNRSGYGYSFYEAAGKGIHEN